jgi:hypothetical protein
MTTGVKYCEGNHTYIKHIRHYKVHFKLNYIIGLRSGVLVFVCAKVDSSLTELLLLKLNLETLKKSM